MRRELLVVVLVATLPGCRRKTPDVKAEPIPLPVTPSSVASPPAPAPLPAPTASVARPPGECSSRLDCTTEGETCCAPDPDHASCMTPNAVDSTPCGFEVCNTDGDRGTCPEGQSCVKGICRPEAPGVTCGNDRCPKDTPYCVWAAGAGKCVSAADAEKARAAARTDEKAPSVFECTKPTDCGKGFECCNDHEYDAMATREVRVTQCRYGCDSFKFDEVCEKPNECSAGMSFGANGGAFVRTCKKRKASKAYPAWMGECVAK